MKLISIVSPCYNEQDNVEQLYLRTRATLARFPQFRYEHIFIDNASTDNTVAILRELAAIDPHVKVIVNARNFGHLRSPQHALLHAQGDAVGMLLSDLQDPPELMGDMIEEWERGTPISVGIKNTSEESWLMYRSATLYYGTIARLTSVAGAGALNGIRIVRPKVIEICERISAILIPIFAG